MLDFNLGIQFFKGAPLGVFDGLQFFNGTYLATVLQSWFIGVRFFKAEICPGSHSLRGYQWSLKDSGVRVGGRIARGMYYDCLCLLYIYIIIIILLLLLLLLLLVLYIYILLLLLYFYYL